MADTVAESIDKYYKMKDEYESGIKKKVDAIRKDDTKSLKEKRNEFKKLKPLCLLCKRPGGTIFSTTVQGGRIVSAVCGSETPCNLDIKINLGEYESARTMIASQQENLNKLKDTVIHYKNQLLFGYKTAKDILEDYEAIKSEISDANIRLVFYIQEYFDIIDSPKKNDKLKRLVEKSYNAIGEMKEYIANNNVDDAVGIYVHQLSPILKEIMQNKYSSSSVAYDDETKTFALVQQKYTLQDIETNDIHQPEVIKFNMSAPKKAAQKQKQPQDDDDDSYGER